MVSFMRKFPRLLWVIIAACSVNEGISQVRSVNAVKITQPPKLDGKADDKAWENVQPATDFIINQPQFGQKASKKSEVKIVYDNAAIYILAMLYDDPDLIRKQLTPRDKEQRQDVDFFSVAFDTYNDNQNGFQFIVTTANVQSDARISSSGTDYNWDAVWDSKTSITSTGWIVEMKIPYMALRFAKKEVQDWGVNFGRFTRRTNETEYWNPVDPNINGFVNQFGDLKGLEKIEPPLRLSFLPYISSGYSIVPTKNGTQQTFLRNGGMDVKYGVNESFTLDMTLVPDFGQVQSDNVILNLSPFEQQFNENRPFFTEGTELFNKAGIFYSRRVGSIPSGYGTARRLAADSSWEILSNPTATQLYNASKFSGRNKNNLGIGVFNAVTAPMHARFINGKGDEVSIETEPLANYNLIVLDQAFKNRSSITFTNTNVLRNGSARDANVSAVDLYLFDKKNTHRFRASGRFSQVWGNENYNGYKTILSYGKISGKINYNITNNIESERYDPNDMGILFAPNEFSTTASISYNQNTPTKHFNFYSYSLNFSQQNLYKPFAYNDFKINGRMLFLFKNWWDISFNFDASPFWSNDYFELRIPGRKLKKAPFVYVGLNGSSDSRKKLYGSWGLGMGESPIKDDPYFYTQAGLRYRFSPRFTLETGLNRNHDLGNFGWNLFDAQGNPVIGRRNILQTTGTVNGIYNFTSRMNLTLRARHYWSRVNYVAFFDVKNDGYWTERSFIPGRDRNFNVFNIDMFYTWDFKLGSRLIVAWKNALGPDASLNGMQHNNYGKNLTNIFSIPHSNEISVKMVYFLDYLQLKGKRA